MPAQLKQGRLSHVMGRTRSTAGSPLLRTCSGYGSRAIQAPARKLPLGRRSTRRCGSTPSAPRSAARAGWCPARCAPARTLLKVATLMCLLSSWSTAKFQILTGPWCIRPSTRTRSTTGPASRSSSTLGSPSRPATGSGSSRRREPRRRCPRRCGCGRCGAGRRPPASRGVRSSRPWPWWTTRRSSTSRAWSCGTTASLR
mmetsp:Transcript_7520/g.12531  ORF Transcript_7520/g.12531 Transcript_7520/m.12531 type:complete len:200 (+) Transcript_7520:399-998(+)